MGQVFSPFTGYAVLPDGQRSCEGTGSVIYRPQSIDQHAGQKLNLPEVGRGIPSFRFTCRFEIEVFMQRGIVWVVDDDSSIRYA